MAPSDDRKAEAEIYDRSENGREKTMKLLELVGLPNGLILLDDIQECGYVKKTGFVWMKWKVEHKFKEIRRLVQYDTEISGYVEQHKMKSKEKMKEVSGVKSKEKMKEVSGVKSKELREWITISEISIDDPASAKMKDLREWITISEISIDDPTSAKICFKSDIGNNKSFPVGDFQIGESDIAAIKKGSE